MATDDLCKRCGHAPEDILHCFWSCLKAKAIWQLLDPSLLMEVFQPDVPWSDVKVAGLSRSLLNDILLASKGTTHLIPSLPISKWVPPPVDYYKVNCDASIFHERQLARFDCVLRDVSGSWVLGCYGHIPVWTIFRCELLAVWNGLMLAWEAGCQNDLLRRNWNVQFVLIKREANFAADWMAKKDALSNSDYCLWTAPGEDLAEILCQEAAGLS
ncbi:hypothetical protein PIB30_008342 [Stylosanthes scabra]|uniref:RNase H type-1 domain-containing protein n=1 Tax=Stylosanthes scabra TaxID=79078 RepID=A0ABU6T4S0_9FABA|nr:hypothetical protein [Stylosanthes scabra]